MTITAKQIKAFAGVALVVLFALGWNQLIYYSAIWISESHHHYDMTTNIDRAVPFLPWTTGIYFGCYLLWIANYFLCAADKNTTRRDRFFSADALSKLMCFVLFVLVPTTNIRPEVVGDTFWDALTRHLYHIDSPVNLFPSIHCLVSWLCWVGVRDRKDVPAVHRWFSLAVAIAVCISTLTTKQHVIVDVLAGVGLAEGCYLLTGRFEKLRTVYATVISFFKKILHI